LLGETSKFVPFSPVRFTSIRPAAPAAATAFVLAFRGAPGEQVEVSCATAAGGIHRTVGKVGADGKGSMTLDTATMWV
jgi:hypothetical protein